MNRLRRDRTTERSKVVGLLEIAMLVIATSAAAQGESDPPAVSCEGRWRGIAYEKVKAGEEHCGLIERQRKDLALDAACDLASTRAEELRELADSRAWSRVQSLGKDEHCRCSAQPRPWQNVYTHVLSQRCWTECGWAVLIECEPRELEPTDAVSGEGGAADGAGTSDS